MHLFRTSLVAQMVKHLPTTWETWVRSLGQEDPLEKEMATHSSTLGWKIPWMEEPGKLLRVAKTQTRLSNFTFTFHFHALEKEMATHSSVLAWRILGMVEPGGLPSMGSQSRTRLKRLSSSSSSSWIASGFFTKRAIREALPTKVVSVQSYGFSSSHVWMQELDHKESWALKNWCFWTVVLEKTLENPLNCHEIQPVSPKWNQSWIFIGRTDAEAKAPILWPPDVKNWLIGKDPDAGKDLGQEEKWTT